MVIEFINENHPLLPKVKQLGRKCAATLGFMPEGGFDDHAARRNIIIASEGDELLGYLMFREVSRHSRVTIVHLAVDDDYRGKGISTQLLDTLRDHCKESGAMGISLSCRKDFEYASRMYERYGFNVKATRRSRSIEKHYLNTWWYDFNQRNLFTAAYEESTKPKALMDLNVILKLRDCQLNPNLKMQAKEDPRCLLADWLGDEVELCFAPEVYNEINRDDDLERMKKTNIYVTGVFTQAIVNAEKQKQVEQSLREILPGRSANTVSDRKQVASCVAAGIPYFITFDEGILGQKERIEAGYDVQIYTPQEFMLRIDQLLHRDDYAPVLLRGVVLHSLHRLDAEGVKQCVDRFLNKGKRERKHELQNRVNGCLNARGELLTVNDRERTLAFYGVAVEGEAARIDFLRIDAGPLNGSLLCQIAAETLQSCIKKGLKRMELTEPFLTDEQKSVLVRFGFIERNDGVFVKHICDRVVSLGDLMQVQQEAGIEQPAMPKDVSQLVQMERMFFPLKIRELEIPTYIIPIRPYWAGQLFDNVISSENLFGAEPDKLWSIENVYYRHTMPITEKAPARILWYVSGGGTSKRTSRTHVQTVVGCSYLTEVQTGKGKDLFRMYKHYGIYEWDNIYELCDGKDDKDIRALKFSHTELFRHPVTYDRAQELLVRNGFKRNTFASPVLVSSAVFFDMYEIGRCRQ
jgi:GNAT superfamily N-acetyltransferase